MNNKTDILVVRQYESYGVKVLVRIDRRTKSVALVEYNDATDAYIPKEWTFSGRTLKYMNGWRSILLAMDYAVQEAKKELESFDDEDTDKLLQTMIALNEMKEPEPGDA